MKKNDLRVIKTRKSLYMALLKLMKDTPFEEIKVNDICSVALINRSTFYAHYNDKYELLVDFVNDLKTSLLNALDKNEHIVNTKEFYLKMIELILEHIESEKDVYYSILMSNKNSIITDVIVDVTIKDINKRIEINNIHNRSIPTDILVKFYLGAVSSVIIEWLTSKDKYTSQQILHYLNELIPDNL